MMYKPIVSPFIGIASVVLVVAEAKIRKTVKLIICYISSCPTKPSKYR